MSDITPVVNNYNSYNPLSNYIVHNADPKKLLSELNSIDVGNGISRSYKRDKRIAIIQNALIELGYLSLKGNTIDGKTLDGKYGPRTYNAILKFRQEQGIFDNSDLITKRDILALIEAINTKYNSLSNFNSPSSKVDDVRDDKYEKLQQQIEELKNKLNEQNKKVDEIKISQNSEKRWFDNTELKGDLRFRYQGDTNSDGEKRNRFRIRGRLGIDVEVNDKASLHAGIATGSGDPRSTNVTLEGEFSAKQINLDYAYAKYKPIDWAEIKLGKIKQEDLFWQPTDLVWDTDINPEGIGASVNKKIDKEGKYEFFLNAGHLFFGKSDFNLKGPTISFVQPGIKANFDNGFYAKAAVDVFYSDGFKGEDPTKFKYSSGTNTLTTLYEYSYDEKEQKVNVKEIGKEIKYDYDTVGASIEVGKKFEKGKIAAIYGNYVTNTKVKNNNNGYAVGVKYGDEKVDDKGKWEIRALYRHLEKDACLDMLPDSDAFGGKTGTKGYKLSAAYGLSKNVSINASYYDMRMIDDEEKTDKVLQLDFNIKFGGSKKKKTPSVPTLDNNKSVKST